jgi:hypothetical protein
MADGRRLRVVRVVHVVGAQAELLEVVTALDAGRGLAHLLDGWQEQADQDGDDGDHHQQLDQGEARAVWLRIHVGPSFQAKMSLTTLPATSVRRKLRPA